MTETVTSPSGRVFVNGCHFDPDGGKLDKGTSRAVSRMLQTPGVLLIDLRVASEVEGGRYPLLTLEDEGKEVQSCWMPSMLDTVCNHIDQAITTDLIPSRKTTPIVCYCGSGRRGALAAGRLHNRGYSNIVNAGSVADMHRAIDYSTRQLRSPRGTGGASEACEVGCTIA